MMAREIETAIDDVRPMSIQHLRRLFCALVIAGAVLLTGCAGGSTPPATTPGATAPAGTPGPTAKPGDAGEGQPIPYPAYRPPENNTRPTP